MRTPIRRESMFVRRTPKSLACWGRTRAKGRSSFVRSFGVLGWGIPTAVAAAIGFPTALSASRVVGDAIPLARSLRCLAVSLLLFPALGPVIATAAWFESERAYVAAMSGAEPGPRTYPRWVRWIFRTAIGVFVLLAFLAVSGGRTPRESGTEWIPEFAIWAFAAPFVLWAGLFGWLLLSSRDQPPADEPRVEAAGPSGPTA